VRGKERRSWEKATGTQVSQGKKEDYIKERFVRGEKRGEGNLPAFRKNGN